MISRLCSMGLAAVLLGGCVIAPSAGPTTPDGLQKRASNRVDSVYAAPGASLARYRRVMLDELDVAFKADWQQRHPEITPTEIGDVRTLGAALFRAAFSAELEKGGYAIVDQPAPDVLRVKATVLDVDFAPAAAAAASVGGRYIVSTTDVSLAAELRDSASGAVLARIIDRNRGRNVGNLEMSSEQSTSKDALQAFTTWAGLLREALDSAREPLAK
ncbi:MAG TPA: DUF3313 family protein [Steroidobacteraceae bacterium]|nr:DUF3313 family protein [Steroidobacteraceae bacterium]